MEERDDDPRPLVKAFGNVAEAGGGVSELARCAKSDRVALSPALSDRRNPRLDPPARVVAECGVELRFETQSGALKASTSASCSGLASVLTWPC